MAISVVSTQTTNSTTTNAAGSTPLSVTLPSPIDAGDKIYVWHGANPGSTGAPTAPTGFTLEDTTTFSASYADHVFVKENASGTEGGTVVSIPSALAGTSRRTAIAWVVKGAAAGGPALTAEATAASGAAKTVPSVTPTQAATIVAIWNERGGTATLIINAPPGMAKLADRMATGGGQISVALATATTAAGTYAPGDWDPETTPGTNNLASSSILRTWAFYEAGHNLAPAETVNANTSDSPTVTQTHQLVPAATSNANTADSPELSELPTLAPAATTNTNAATSPAVTQTHQLAPAATTTTNTTGSPSVSSLGLVDVLPTTYDASGVKITVIAHRGGRAEGPDHTLDLYNHAVAIPGLRAIEFDAHLSAENKVYCWHDPVINLDGSGRAIDDSTTPVSSVTIASSNNAPLDAIDVRASAGIGPSAFTAATTVLDAHGSDVACVAEAKVDSVVSQLIADIVSRGLQRNVLFQSFTPARVYSAIAAGIPGLVLYGAAPSSGTLDTLVANGVEWVACELASFNSTWSALVHSKGMKAGVYTTNTVGEFTTVRAAGADFVFVDNPTAVMAAIGTVHPVATTNTNSATQPTLTQTHTLTPASTTNVNSSDTATLTQTHTLTPVATSNGNTADSPTVTEAVTVAPLTTTNANTADSPTVTQSHQLAPEATTVTSTATSPVVTTPSSDQPGSASISLAGPTATAALTQSTAVVALVGARAQAQMEA